MLLGLDLGTTNIKALLVGAHGAVVARGSAPVALMHTDDGGVEQDIEAIWSATLDAVTGAGTPAQRSTVRAVGVSSQGGAMQVLDGDYRPVGPVISWLDGRGNAYDRDITDALGRDWLVRHIGRARTGMAVGQVLRLRDRCPDRLRRPHRIGFVGDVIVSRLCGRGAHDATSLSIAMLLNPSLCTPDADLLDRLGIDADQLPALVPAHTPAGGLLSDVARVTSLPVGIPVSPAVHDQYASSLGVGAIHDGDVMLGAGTAWVLLAATPTLADPVTDDALVCPHVVDGLYGQMLAMANGGSAVTWVCELLGLDTGVDIDARIAAVPAGSDGVRFWALLASVGGAGLVPGTPGRITGLQLFHKGDHILRAVVEGLALELARYLRRMADAGIEPRRLVLGGGAADSRVTPQIVADATGLPVACALETATSALGAAVLGRALAEPHADLGALSEAMCPEVRVFAPGPDAGRYRRLLDAYLDAVPQADERGKSR